MRVFWGFIVCAAMLGAPFFGLYLVAGLLSTGEHDLREPALLFLSCLALIAIDKFPQNEHQRKKPEKKLPSNPATKPADLSHMKAKILHNAQHSSLSYSKLMSILDNKHRFGFSQEELQILENCQVTGPFPEAPVKPSQNCTRCGGSGYITAYGNYEGGRCFSCNPDGQITHPDDLYPY